MKILQRNLDRSTFVAWEVQRHHNMCWKWPRFASRQDWTRHAIFLKVLASTSAKNKHSLLQNIPIYFPTILCELTHYTNTHEQQPYCAGTLSQMTERSAERRVRQETGWLAGGHTLQTHSSSFLTQRTYSCSNFFSISSLVLELLKKCRVR